MTSKTISDILNSAEILEQGGKGMDKKIRELSIQLLKAIRKECKECLENTGGPCVKECPLNTFERLALDLAIEIEKN